MKKNDYLIPLLLDKRLVTPEQVASARAQTETTNKDTVDFMVSQKFLTAEDVARAIGEHFGAQYITIGEIQPEVIGRVPKDLARKYHVVPIAVDGNVVRIAMEDPSQIDDIDALQHLLEHEIELVTASRDGILKALNEHYPERPEGQLELRLA